MASTSTSTTTTLPLPTPKLLLTLALLLLLLATLRLLSILPPRPAPAPRIRGSSPTHLLIVLGSGGHTAEMFALLRDLDPTAYTHRAYVVSSGDAFSAEKAREFEQGLVGRWKGKGEGKAAETGTGTGTYDIIVVPRARRVHQPLLTTPWSAGRCLGACVRVLLRSGPDADFPDLIVTNGPATGVLVVLAAVLLRFGDVRGAHARDRMRTVYVESWARVRRLSLSGRLLLRVVDRFLVQWPQLEGVGGRAEYRGVLIQ